MSTVEMQQKFNARRQEILQMFQVFQQGLTGNTFMATQHLAATVMQTINNLEQEVLPFVSQVSSPLPMTPSVEPQLGAVKPESAEEPKPEKPKNVPKNVTKMKSEGEQIAEGAPATDKTEK